MKVLRERKQINYAAENHAGTPLWLKSSSQVPSEEDDPIKSPESDKSGSGKAKASSKKAAEKKQQKGIGSNSSQDDFNANDKRGSKSRQSAPQPVFHKDTKATSAASGRPRSKSVAALQELHNIQVVDEIQAKAPASKKAPNVSKYLAAGMPVDISTGKDLASKADKSGKGSKRKCEAAMEQSRPEPTAVEKTWKAAEKTAQGKKNQISPDAAIAKPAKKARSTSDPLPQPEPKAPHKASGSTKADDQVSQEPPPKAYASTKGAEQPSQEQAKKASASNKASEQPHQEQAKKASASTKAAEQARQGQAKKKSPPAQPAAAPVAEVEHKKSSSGKAAARQNAKGNASDDAVVPPASKEQSSSQEADPEVAQLLAPVAAGPDASSAFTNLQGQYMRLQELYQQLKSQKIQDLEGMLEEQDLYVERITAANKELAEKWHLEAEKANELARLSGSAETQQKLEALEEENLELLSQVQEAQAIKAEAEEKLAEVTAQLAEAMSALAVYEGAGGVAELSAKVSQLSDQLNLVTAEAARQADALAEARAEAIRQASAVVDSWTEAERQAKAVTEAKEEASRLAALVEELKAEVEKQSKDVAEGEARSPLLVSLAAGADALRRSFSISVQCPTPAAPSPGVACQFPSPPAWLTAAIPAGPLFPTPAPSHNKRRSLEVGIVAKALTPPHGGPLGFGVTPAARRSRFASICNVGVQLPHESLMVPETAAGGAKPPDTVVVTTAVAAGSDPDSGSPIDGLCEGKVPKQGQQQAKTTSLTESLPRSLIPEGEDPLGPLPPAVAVFAEEQRKLDEEVVDLDPLSPRKLRAKAAFNSNSSAYQLAEQQQQQVRRHSVAHLPMSHSTTEGPSMMKLGGGGGTCHRPSLPPVLSPGLQPQQSPQIQAQLQQAVQQQQQVQRSPVAHSPRSGQPPLSTAMAQLVQTARTATAALRSVSRSVNMRVQAPSGLADMDVEEAQHSAGEEGGCGQQHSHEVSTNLPIPKTFPQVPRQAGGDRGLGIVASNQPSSANDSLVPPAKTPARAVPPSALKGRNSKKEPLPATPAVQFNLQPSGSVGENPSTSHQRTPPAPPQSARKLTAVTPGLTPRARGVVSFFGFKVVPQQQDGWYEYIHPESGLRFELGPASSLEDEELMEDEEVASGPLLEYRPLVLGKARLPEYLKEDIWMPVSQKQVFVNRIWGAVNGHGV